MSSTALIILIIVNFPVFWFFGWAIFREWDEFIECFRIRFRPNIILLSSEIYSKDFWAEMCVICWAEMRLGFWTVCCVAAVCGEYYLITRVFLHHTGG